MTQASPACWKSCWHIILRNKMCPWQETQKYQKSEDICKKDFWDFLRIDHKARIHKVDHCAMAIFFLPVKPSQGPRASDDAISPPWCHHASLVACRRNCRLGPNHPAGALQVASVWCLNRSCEAMEQSYWSLSLQYFSGISFSLRDCASCSSEMSPITTSGTQNLQICNHAILTVVPDAGRRQRQWLGFVCLQVSARTEEICGRQKNKIENKEQLASINCCDFTPFQPPYDPFCVALSWMAPQDPWSTHSWKQPWPDMARFTAQSQSPRSPRFMAWNCVVMDMGTKSGASALNDLSNCQIRASSKPTLPRIAK